MKELYGLGLPACHVWGTKRRQPMFAKLRLASEDVEEESQFGDLRRCSRPRACGDQPLRTPMATGLESKQLKARVLRGMQCSSPEIQVLLHGPQCRV